jgi:hypothetical protein
MRPGPAPVFRSARPIDGRGDLPRLGLVLAAMALLASVPFLGAAIPSMTDLPGHIGRYAVMLDGGRSADLASYYAFTWKLVGNLGVDVLVHALGWLGAERAAWLVAAAIAPLTIFGMAAVSHALHGRIQPAAVAAACFALANPLMFGFVNYSLSFALALLTFAAWIRLRDAPAWWTVPLLAIAALATWIAHAMGCGVLALLAGGFELERLWQRRSTAALADALLRGLALLPPLILTLAWQSGDHGALMAWGDSLVTRKVMNWVVMLRGEAKWIDLATPVLIALACLAAWRRQLIDWRIGAGAVLIALACLVMPTTMFGSWGADERIAPAAVIAALLSLRWRGSRRGAIALGGLAAMLFGVRTMMIARDWRRLDEAYASHLAALQLVPAGARIHAVVLQDPCHSPWRATAYNHLPSLAIGRRHAMVNSQWLLPGAALLTVRGDGDPALIHDPSQMVDGFDCNGPLARPLGAKLAQIRGGGWQYLWVLGTRGHDPWPGAAPVYADGNSALYRLPAG